jgi:hypothetical protein
MPDSDIPPFEPFPKMGRLFRDVIVTEKIDGTNASVTVLPDGRVIAASRTRHITPEDDNFGFARWVKDHEGGLRDALGEGKHFGEWWGSGIQRGYGLPKGEKRFSLFNVSRFESVELPEFLSVVPVLYRGAFDTALIAGVAEQLQSQGSAASPGFMDPEGIVVFHPHGNVGFKFTLDGDAHKAEEKRKAYEAARR